MCRLGLKKISMSVPEMRETLGLKKTESYWLVKKKYFKTVIVGGRMRVMVDSFEEWYAKQLHYKKVNGEAPGSKWAETTFSILETANLLGITASTLYDLLKKNYFKTLKVGYKTRVDKESFEKWYTTQTYYKRNEEAERRLDYGVYY